jgi:hypothetical protein
MVQLARAYQGLFEVAETSKYIRVLPFTSGAIERYLDLRSQLPRLNRSTHRWHTLGSVRCAHGYVALSLFVRLAHATQGWPEICVYESLVV